ncbi:MAG: Spy/CpxP family protein refolding chaperone [Methylovirgula sp.]
MRKLKVSGLIVACMTFASLLVQAEAAPKGNETIERLCSERTPLSHDGAFADWLARRLDLNDVQKATFEDFQAARAKALADSKTKLCTSKPDLTTFEGRLVFGQSFYAARLDALKLENPKLIAFYKSLDARQQKIFDKIREQLHRR